MRRHLARRNVAAQLVVTQKALDGARQRAGIVGTDLLDGPRRPGRWLPSSSAPRASCRSRSAAPLADSGVSSYGSTTRSGH